MKSWDEIVLALALLTQGVVLGLLLGRCVAEQEAPQRAVIRASAMSAGGGGACGAC